MPSPLVELAIGAACAMALLGLRILLYPLTGDLAPYSFIFLAVVSASVLGGWRSGLVALVVGQALTWQLIAGTTDIQSSEFAARIGGFAIVTIAQLFVLAVIALYQREVAKALAEQDREMSLLSDALREIDHRTKNNYQTVVSLIMLQSQRSENAEVRKSLAEAADRIRAVSLASDQLALRSADLGKIRLNEHLCELCSQIRRGLVGDEVSLDCEIEDIIVSTDTAIHLSIVVNELVTNALKHAFAGPQDNAAIAVSCAAQGKGLELVVADNGQGMPDGPARKSGLGNRLIDRFVKDMGGTHDIQSSPSGTTHRIRLREVL